MKKIFTFISVVMLASCGQMDSKKEADVAATPAFTAPADWKTMQQENYSIQYPATWELSQPGQGGTLFQVVSPLESDSDKFRENINLVTEDLTGKNVDLDTYEKASLDQIKTAFQDFKMMEDKKIKVGAAEYYKIRYSASQGDTHMELEQWLRIEKEKAYILTFVVEKGKYDKFKDIGENILATFTVKN